MLNREWIQKMSLIDFLNYFVHNCDQCVLCMLGVAAYTNRCDEFYDEEKSLDETCYNCISAWLNEPHSYNK